METGIDMTPFSLKAHSARTAPAGDPEKISAAVVKTLFKTFFALFIRLRPRIFQPPPRPAAKVCKAVNISIYEILPSSLTHGQHPKKKDDHHDPL